MSTPITYGMDAVPDTAARAAGRFQRALERFMAAREAQASRRVLDYLSALPDEQLAALGYTEAQIRQIRVEHRLPDRADF
ncbi:MAG: hypothetical protein KJZ80_12015 [Hyphomicrobiaceae bacterium]|nr:hypothetical protein [Hyphomicrobiaceae bacterium]